jgi:hypothetical protein
MWYLPMLEFQIQKKPRLDEADEPRSVLDEDVWLTGLLSVGLGRDQQFATSRLLCELAHQGEQRFAQ